MCFLISKAGHECSRNIDASRPEVREQIEHFWWHAPPIPSGLSVDEHADLPTKAARVAWRRAAPRVQAAPKADWMDDEAWQAVLKQNNTEGVSHQPIKQQQTYLDNQIRPKACPKNPQTKTHGAWK